VNQLINNVIYIYDVSQGGKKSFPKAEKRENAVYGSQAIINPKDTPKDTCYMILE